MINIEKIYHDRMQANVDEDLTQTYLQKSYYFRKKIYDLITDLLSPQNNSAKSRKLKEQIEAFEIFGTNLTVEQFYEQKKFKTKIFISLIENIFANPLEFNISFNFSPSAQDQEWCKTLLIHDLIYYGPVTILSVKPFLEATSCVPINSLLNTICDYKKITEIKINSSEKIFIEAGSNIFSWPVNFIDDEQVETIIKRLISESNLLNGSSIKINSINPIADFEHPCGYIRGSAVIPPVAEKSFFTLRIHPTKAYNLNDLMSFGMLDKQIKDFFTAIQQAGTTIAIAGTMGSGKTTLLSALAELWPDRGRKATIEDTPELKPLINNLIKMRTIDSEDTQKNIGVTKLTKACKRHSVSHVILSEARDGSAWEILQLSQSILGCIMTYHYTPRSNQYLVDQSLNTLVALCKQHELAPQNNDIKHLIASMVQILVLVEQSPFDYKRRIRKIYYVTGFDEFNGGHFKAIELFSFDEQQKRFVQNNICKELEDYLAEKGVVYKFDGELQA